MEEASTDAATRRKRGWTELAVGVAVGFVVPALLGRFASNDVLAWILSRGPQIAGAIIMAHAVAILTGTRSAPSADKLVKPHLAILILGLVFMGVSQLVIWRSIGEGRWWHWVVWYLPFAAGRVMIAYAIVALARAPGQVVGPTSKPLMGFRSFVAWRYLLGERRVSPMTRNFLAVSVVVLVALFASKVVDMQELRVAQPALLALATRQFAIVVVLVYLTCIVRCSPPAFGLFLIGALTFAGALVSISHLMPASRGPFGNVPDVRLRDLQVLSGVMIGGAVIAGLALFTGTLRAFFTFFTTVPIVGVWIGTTALVCVLSVMSGFETDLREKILGSNAHIQITKEDGDFTDWEAIKARIDKVPGVVASTPYAVSEVVIAAHNNGMNVIIKGIDPKSVSGVTDIVNDLEDKNAMKLLEPIVDTSQDLTVPQAPHDPNAQDPAPEDLPTAADPIDFSGEGSGAKAPAPDNGAPSDFGGDANDVQADEIDPPPDDFAHSYEIPQDFTKPQVPSALSDARIDVVDMGAPELPLRTKSLHGVLVGRELVKQTHLYTGEEVRVVSPLSDPSNPDATGTPIPFNRDYRVAGVFFTGMYEYDLKYVYVTLDSLQDFLDRGNAIDGIEVRCTSPDDSGRMKGVLSKELGAAYRVVDWRELNQSLFSALKLEKIAMFLVLGIVILVASFSILGNLIMVVVEKQRQIALLKTLGASDWAIVHLFAIQGMMIGLIGTVLGIASGLAACWAGKTFGLPLDPNVYYIDKLPIHVEASSVIGAGIAGVVISLLATLYPAFLAARVRPAAGMRH